MVLFGRSLYSPVCDCARNKAIRSVIYREEDVPGFNREAV